MIRCFFCTKKVDTYNIARLKIELALDIYVYVCNDCLIKYNNSILEVIKRGEKIPYLFYRNYRNSARDKTGASRYHKRHHKGGKGK
ncbi:MAG: hypothetical protein ACK4M3_07215, partial [Pyrobaculum sp.]